MYALVMQTLYFSQFFTHFRGGLHRICSCSNVRLFKLPVICVSDKSEPEMKATFS